MDILLHTTNPWGNFKLKSNSNSKSVYCPMHNNHTEYTIISISTMTLGTVSGKWHTRQARNVRNIVSVQIMKTWDSMCWKRFTRAKATLTVMPVSSKLVLACIREIVVFTMCWFEKNHFEFTIHVCSITTLTQSKDTNPISVCVILIDTQIKHGQTHEKHAMRSISAQKLILC